MCNTVIDFLGVLYLHTFRTPFDLCIIILIILERRKAEVNICANMLKGCYFKLESFPVDFFCASLEKTFHGVDLSNEIFFHKNC